MEIALNANFHAICCFRYLPSVVSLLALDFLWPVVGNGPMFSQVAKELLDKCTKSWWRNVLFLSNNSPVLETVSRALEPLLKCSNTRTFFFLSKCAAHTFHLSADLQLFALGLLAVFLLTKSRVLGLGFALGLIALGNYMLFEKAARQLTSPVMMDAADVSARKTMAFFEVTQLPTYSHLSSYFFGLLTAFALKTGFLNISAQSVSIW